MLKWMPSFLVSLRNIKMKFFPTFGIAQKSSWRIFSIINKKKQVLPAMIESVQPMPTLPEITFLVRGGSTHATEIKTYCVDFGTRENFPRCSCPWFRRNLSLCKHVFVVIDSGYREFEDLIPLYRNHSLRTIDTDHLHFCKL